MTNLISQELMNLLILLDASHEDGNEWVSNKAIKSISRPIRQEAQRAHLVEGQGNTHMREYRLTETGRRVMITGEMETDGTLNGHHPVTKTPPPPAGGGTEGGLNPAKLAAAQAESALVRASLQTARCENCTYRQALDILAAQHPAVKQLVDALESIKTLGG